MILSETSVGMGPKRLISRLISAISSSSRRMKSFELLSSPRMTVRMATFCRLVSPSYLSVAILELREHALDESAQFIGVVIGKLLEFLPQHGRFLGLLGNLELRLDLLLQHPLLLGLVDLRKGLGNGGSIGRSE